MTQLLSQLLTQKWQLPNPSKRKLVQDHIGVVLHRWLNRGRKTRVNLAHRQRLLATNATTWEWETIEVTKLGAVLAFSVHVVIKQFGHDLMGYHSTYHVEHMGAGHVCICIHTCVWLYVYRKG